MKATPRTLPMTAGALLTGTEIHTHTSVRGDVPPRPHPQVAELLAGLPVEARERYTGWCAEVVLISDRLYVAEEAAGRPLTAHEGRAALWGSKLRVSRVREPGDPTHGTVQPPCRSCAPLLDWFGVEVISE